MSGVSDCDPCLFMYTQERAFIGDNMKRLKLDGDKSLIEM